MNQLLTDWQAEIDQLIADGATHDPALHESAAAKVDLGGMKFCPGCRLLVLERRRDKLTAAQTRQRAALGGRSQRQVFLTEMLAARALEVQDPQVRTVR